MRRIIAKRSHFTLWSPMTRDAPAEFLGFGDNLLAFKAVEDLAAFVGASDEPPFGEADSWADLNLPPTLEPLEHHVFEMDSVHMWLAGSAGKVAAAAEVADLLSMTADLAARFNLATAERVLQQLPAPMLFQRFSVGDCTALETDVWDRATQLVRRNWRAVVSEIAAVIEDANIDGLAASNRSPYQSQPVQRRPLLVTSPVGGDPGLRIAALTAPDGTTVYVPTQVPTSGEAIAALVASILWIFGIGSVLAVIIGHNSLSQIRAGERHGRGLATSALVLGYIGIIQGLWFWFVLHRL